MAHKAGLQKRPSTPCAPHPRWHRSPRVPEISIFRASVVDIKFGPMMDDHGWDFDEAARKNEQ